MTDRNRKNPSSLVYWLDLAQDPELNRCSIGARGLWAVKMLPCAAQSPEYGVVIVGQHGSRREDLAALFCREIGEPEETTAAFIDELVMHGAASVDNEGRVFCRRMVREEHVRQVRSAAGKRGAAATNSIRQKSGKHPGKALGKAVGNDTGKEPGKHGDKTAAAESALSHDGERRIDDQPPAEARQNVGKAIDEGSGNIVDDPLGKSSPSSLPYESKKELGESPTGFPPDEIPPPIAARASPAGALPHAMSRRPRIADQVAALVAEHRAKVLG